MLPQVKKMRTIIRICNDIRQGYITEKVPDSYATLLAAAIKNKDYESVKRLIERGDQISARNLHQAISNKKGMCNIILQAAAEDVEDKTYNPRVVIILILLFLAKNLPIDIKNHDGETPLLLAAKRKNKQIVEFLLRQKANLKACDKNGNSILHIVIKHNNYENDLKKIQEDNITAEFVEWLIFKGANVQQQNNANESPLFFSVIYRQTEVIKVLLNHTTKISDFDNKNGIFDIFVKAYLKEDETASDEIVYMIKQFSAKGAVLDMINECEQTKVRDILKEYNNKLHPFT